MKVNVEIITANNGQFANIFICYIEPEIGIEKKVKLKVRNFTNLHDFTNDTSSVGFDFFLISAIVYGIDDLFSRKKYSFNGWTREFEIQFPVNNIEAWNATIESINEALTFLTGDHWLVSFSSLNTRMYVERENRRISLIPQYDFAEYEFASLFSGSLDSLIGVIDQLDNLTIKRKGIFISHYDNSYNGSKGDQNALLKKIDNTKVDTFRTMVGLSSDDNTGGKINRDGNQRSRSILFLGIGCYMATNANLNELLMPENGTISLNHPLTVSRSSSLSTRTTHPYFIQKLHEVFDLVEIDLRIINPFKFKTKGEMVLECKDRDLLIQTYQDSASCGKRRPQPTWDTLGAKQCGTCMPCIYRRASLHKLNLDNEDFGKDLLSHDDPINTSKADMPALFDYLKSDLPVEKIKRNLLVNGSITQEDLDNYANVVVRSRGEILSWIKDKGSQQLKTALEI